MPKQPNMNQMMRQVQQMQADMAKAQEELKHASVEASAGGGMVTVKVSGELEILELRIDPGGGRPGGRGAAPGHGPGGHERGAALGSGDGGDRRWAAVDRSGSAGPQADLGPPGVVAPCRATLKALFAPPVNRLITELGRLPGIGQRTAQRLAFHLLRVSDEEALALADAIREVKSTVRRCEICFNLATEPTCRICQDERRDSEVICVVEEPSDVIPIERTNEFSGRYHVLGGALSPIDGVDPEDLHIGELLERASSNGVREVVVATNATTTGEATALYLADALRERAPGVTVTRLASGLPVGADLEYADEVTLGSALRGRRAL